MKNYKNYLLAFGLVALQFAVNAKLKQIVEVDKIKEQSDRINYFMAILPRHNMNLSSYNLSIYDLKFAIVGQFGVKVLINANYTYSLLHYLSGSEDAGTSNAVSMYEITKAI